MVQGKQDWRSKSKKRLFLAVCSLNRDRGSRLVARLRWVLAPGKSTRIKAAGWLTGQRTGMSPAAEEPQSPTQLPNFGRDLQLTSFFKSHSSSKEKARPSKNTTATMDRAALRTLARSRHLVRPSPTTRPILLPPTPTLTRAVSNVPRIAEVSFWKSLVPKPLRRENRRVRDPGAPKTPWLAREWNPATFFIIIFLLIGSMSIQMISLRSNFEAFTRRADVRIGLLREVVERIQKGEKVDVEKVLGSGDAEREAAWEEGRLMSRPRGGVPDTRRDVQVLTGLKYSAERDREGQRCEEPEEAGEAKSDRITVYDPQGRLDV